MITLVPTLTYPKHFLENDRAHQQHWMINVAFGSNFDAPVHDALEKGIEVLDSGCGKNEFECLY